MHTPHSARRRAAAESVGALPAQPAQCPHCGAPTTEPIDTRWRFNGRDWEHQCGHPQAGHVAATPVPRAGLSDDEETALLEAAYAKLPDLTAAELADPANEPAMFSEYEAIQALLAGRLFETTLHQRWLVERDTHRDRMATYYRQEQARAR